MEIKLVSLEMRNFKGVRSLSVHFDKNTSISGENGTGKTTVFDAFVWLLFGKDSKNASVFNIKTMDSEGNPIHKLEHQVEGIIEIDGTPIKFSRTLKEKWVTRRANAREVMDGHETLYSIDDVPVQAGEYQRRVSQVLNEDIFRMITDPLFFNSKKWTDRRQTLTDMAGNLNDADILNSKPEYRPIVEKIGSRSIEEFKAYITAQKKPIETKLKEIPARVDEVDRGMPEEEDWEALATEADHIKAEIASIDESIIDRSKPLEEFYKSQQERQNKIHEADARIKQIEYNAAQRLQEANNELSAKVRKLGNDISNKEKDIEAIDNRIDGYDRMLLLEKKKRETYLDQWHKINAEEFEVSSDALICPTCSRPFEGNLLAEKEEEMRHNFNLNKAERLAEIQKNGKAQKQVIEDIEASKEESLKRRDSLTKEIEKLRQEKNELPEPQTEVSYTPVESDEIETLRQQSEQMKEEQPKAPIIDVSDMQERKKSLQQELSDLTEQYAKKKRIEEAVERKQELLAEQKTQAENLAEWQKLELLIKDFIKTKMTLVDERVNGKFKYVRFRMFDTQVNGDEVECCDALIDGVPYSDANHAAQINAGIDIINALCDFYGVTAPIFIDNRESVNELIATRSQVISLIVTTDKELLIN